MGVRVGHGYDVHRFTAGDSITLGGVKIPYNQSLLAHSDGDVLIHALVDALLGAAALGDIGQHFPDTDAQYKDYSSQLILEQVVELVGQKGYKVGNIDTTIIAQAPKMSQHIPAMKQILADITDVSVDQVNVKATTTERLGYIGRGEGIAVHAVVILETK